MAGELHGFDEHAARRIVRATKHVERTQRRPPLRNPRAPVYQSPIVVAKITSGTNPYSAVEVVPGTSGTWATRSGGITFAAAGPNKLYERNDADDVAADQIVLAWPAYFDGTASWEWVFDHCCTDQLSVTDATISTNQNNYSLPRTSILNVNASSSFSFTGFTLGGSTPTAGRTVEIANTGTGTITLPHESGSSSSANQVSTPTAASWEIPPKSSVKLKYLGGKWLIADVPKIPVAHTSGGGSGTGFTYYANSGTTADAHATVLDSSGNMAFCWGTIRNTHGSFSLTVEETLEGAFGAAPGAGETPIAAGASYTIVATTHTSGEPLSRARYRVRSTVSGDHATWDSKIAAVVL